MSLQSNAAIAQQCDLGQNHASPNAFRRSFRDLYRRRLKRVEDLIAGSVLAILAAPVIAAAWLAVCLTSKGPGLFAQERVGLNGQLFRFYKLRSMYINQHDQIDMQELAAHEADGILYKTPDDPRITPVGRIIRKTSIDELPQLWNVVRGDMSLVGPRPLVPHMLAPFPELNALRSKVRPGLTGPWQVSARENNTSVRGMIHHDLHYVEHHSMLMDLCILLKTLQVILNTEGAH